MEKERTKERLNNFLKEYEALCNKYNFVVSACGCCDSPYLICLEQDYKDTIKEIKLKEMKNKVKEEIEHLKDEFIIR